MDDKDKATEQYNLANQRPISDFNPEINCEKYEAMLRALLELKRLGVKESPEGRDMADAINNLRDMVTLSKEDAERKFGRKRKRKS